MDQAQVLARIPSGMGPRTSRVCSNAVTMREYLVSQSGTECEEGSRDATTGERDGLMQ